MRKSILMLSSSFLFLTSIVGSAEALTPNEQLKALKDVFVNEFEKMDVNSDGKLSKSEYLRHQFESFRANIMEADGFDSAINDKLLEGLDAITSPSSKTEEKKDEKKTLTKDEEKSPKTTPKDATDIIKTMAEYSIEEGIDKELSDAEQEIEALLSQDDKLTKDDVMPQRLYDEDEDLSALDGLGKLEALEFDEIEDDFVSPTVETKEQKQEKEILSMMSVIKKTLPKKIDDITSWVDIEYKDKIVSYIYKADVDTSVFSSEDKQKLGETIKNEACLSAYTAMCPKIKPMFIDEGINMQIRYVDKNDEELSSCEFNKTTCK